MTTHRTLLSLPLALSNIFRALTAHLSLSLALYVYKYTLQPMNYVQQNQTEQELRSVFG